MFDSSLTGQRAQRLQKIEQLKTLGINPYPNKADAFTFTAELKDRFEQHAGKLFTIAGRLISFREHGQLKFLDVQDESGQIQLYIKSDTIKPTNIESQILGWDDLALLDAGDHVQAMGELTKTQRGEISILVHEVKLLAKAIRPLPDKWQGITDKETRYRRRYLDMTMDPAIRARFVRRSHFWNAIRSHLSKQGFIEVNIPVLEHVTGGADANAFATHFDALDQEFYLRISHELPLKRLLGGGFTKVFDIGPRFRNEGFSDEHLPEHVAMEWYWAYADYRDGMNLTKELFRATMLEVYGTLQFDIKGFHVDLSQEWEELDYCGIIKEKFNVDVFETPIEEVVKVLATHGVKLEGDVNRSRAIDSLWKLIRKTLSGPAFLINEPTFMSPLAKVRKENPALTERFHAIIAGSELANGYSELNDPVDQLGRFVEQQRMREAGDAEAQMLDIDFVEMLEYGMPPAVGFGLSERVFWFFEDVTAKEGVPFPTLRMELDNSTKEIYHDILDLLPTHKEKQAESDSNHNLAEKPLPAQDQILVGQIESIEKHPDADRLQVCQVNIGNAQTIQVLTAATNINVGDLVPIATKDALLYSLKEEKQITFKPRELRGLMSDAMMLSEVELELGSDHGGIMILDQAKYTSQIGKPFTVIA